jgi:glycosyltransferase involved in cell wall biosynthesis
LRSQEKPKICLIVHADTPFTTRMYYKEALTLFKAGYEVHIVAPHETRREVVGGIVIWGIRKRRSKWRRLLPLIDLYRVAKHVAADAYCCHSLESLWVGVLLRKRTGARLFFSAREYYPESYALESPAVLRPIVKGFTRLTEYLCCKTTDHIFAMNDHMRRKYQEWGRDATTVANYPDLSVVEGWNRQARPIDGMRCACKRIVYIGGIDVVKGVFEMIEAMSHVRDRYRDATLELIGFFDSERVETAVRRRVAILGLTDAVVFVGKLPYDVAGKHMSAADIGLYLDHLAERSTYTISNKFFEYLSLGISVVACDKPPTREVKEKHDCCVLVNPNNPEDIATGMFEILDNPEKGADMGRRGKQAVLHTYNWAVESAKMLRIYRTIIGPHCS